MPIRVYSETPGFEECFVEVADAWTVRQVTALYDSREQWLALWREKVTACRIVAGEPAYVLTDPAQVVEQFEELDIRLARFVNSALSAAVDHLATLGGMQRRVLSGVGESLKTTRTPTT